MRSVKDLRRENLQFLVEKYGTMKKLNEALDRNDNNECRKLSTILEENFGKLPCLLSDHLPENDTLFAEP